MIGSGEKAGAARWWRMAVRAMGGEVRAMRMKRLLLLGASGCGSVAVLVLLVQGAWYPALRVFCGTMLALFILLLT